MFSFKPFHKKRDKNCNEQKHVVSAQSQTKQDEVPAPSDIKIMDAAAQCTEFIVEQCPPSLQSPPCDFIFIHSKFEIAKKSTKDVAGTKVRHHPRHHQDYYIPSSEHRCDVDMMILEEMDHTSTSKRVICSKDLQREDSCSSDMTCEDMTTSSTSKSSRQNKNSDTKKGTVQHLKGSWEDKDQTTLIWI